MTHTHKISLRMQDGQLVTYCPRCDSRPVTGIDKMQAEQDEARNLWQELEAE